MKMLDAAKIRDIAGKLSQWAMLAAMVTLCIRSIRAYMAAVVRLYTPSAPPVLTCTYARKRVVNRVIHHRKFAVFAINPDSRAGLSGNL